jgi:hypothetical protein
MAGRKNMGYKTRYTFQVTAEQDAVFQRELKFQREEEAAGTRCTEQGPLIARLLTEACQARNLTRRPAPPADQCDAASVPDGKPEADERDAKDNSPGGDGGGPGMPAAIPG